VGQIEHILVATDGSEGALNAAGLAGFLARGCGARVSIAVVHSEDALVLPAMTSAVLPGSVPFTPFPNPGTVELVQLWGHAAEQICTYAEEHGVDMIVIGRRGQSPFKRLILGGVSSQVVHHASCAVTVVP